MQHSTPFTGPSLFRQVRAPAAAASKTVMSAVLTKLCSLVFSRSLKIMSVINPPQGLISSMEYHRGSTERLMFCSYFGLRY